MKVNGVKVELKEKQNLSNYLNDNNYQIDRVVVEINGEIISKEFYSTRFLKRDDVIEIVHFVGGG